MSNLLRLLELPEPVKNALQGGKITAGHARALLSLENQADQLALCGRIQAEGLSVRDTEAAVKQQLQSAAESADDSATIPLTTAGGTAAAAKADDRTNHVRSLEEQLSALLGTKVEIRLRSKAAGTIRIPFASNDEFERILQHPAACRVGRDDKPGTLNSPVRRAARPKLWRVDDRMGPYWHAGETA
jgi:ParB family chromosome partitioning protein